MLDADNEFYRSLIKRPVREKRHISLSYPPTPLAWRPTLGDLFRDKVMFGTRLSIMWLTRISFWLTRIKPCARSIRDRGSHVGAARHPWTEQNGQKKQQQKQNQRFNLVLISPMMIANNDTRHKEQHTVCGCLQLTTCTVWSWRQI